VVAIAANSAVIFSITSITERIGAVKLATIVNEFVILVALSANILRTANITMTIIANKLAFLAIFDDIVTFFALSTIISGRTDIAVRHATSKLTRTICDIVFIVALSAVILKITSVAVRIIANKLATIAVDFVTIIAYFAPVCGRTDSTVGDEAIKHTSCTDDGEKFKITNGDGDDCSCSIDKDVSNEIAAITPFFAFNDTDGAEINVVIIIPP
jgi:hypothetical protein